MRIYNYNIYDNFLSERRQMRFNNRIMELVPEFKEAGQALEENGRLSYRLLIGDRAIGCLLFPWMQGWQYEGNDFDAAELKEIGKVIYEWIGLWD